MSEGNRSLTPVQWVASVIVFLTIASIIWAIGYGGDLLKDPDKVSGLITFSVAIVIIAIVIILVFYLISGSNASEESKTFRLEFMRIITAVSPMQWVATLIGLLTIGGMVWVMATGADFFLTPEKARGLITFSVAIVTVAIALLLVFYLVIGGASMDELKDRFTFGKDILLVFVGILGTIMGFYYGSGKVTPSEVSAIQNSGQNQASTATILLETKAFELLIKQDYDGAVKAFDVASKATPTSTNISNITAITKFLTDHKDAFSASGDKKDIWKSLYCDISDNKRAVGMSKEIIDKFDSGCRPPATNTAINTAANTTVTNSQPADPVSNANRETSNTATNRR